MPKAFRGEDRQRIQDRLIASGKRALNRVGIKGLTIDDIVAEVGIAKGSFYAFFPSREEFILCVLEAWEDEFRGELLRSLVHGSGTPRERWREFFLGAFALLDREPGLAKIRGADVQRLGERLPVGRLAGHQAEDQRALAEAFGQLVAQGMLTEADAAVLPGVIAALFSMSLFRDQFPPGGYAGASALIAEALAGRLSHE